MTYIPVPRPRPLAPASNRPSFKLFCLTMILSLLLAQFAQFVADVQIAQDTSTAPVKPTFDPGSLPIEFVPNVGQSDRNVQFQAQGLGGTIFFTAEEIVLMLPKAQPSHQAATTSTPDSTATLRLHFIGGNAAPSINSAEQLPGIVNYFLGNDPSKWRTNIPTYGALHYQQLYPGIDLRYDGAGGRLKGTYEVAAGIDPGQVRWSYEGASTVTVNGKGDLVVALPANGAQSAPTLVEQAPIAWQTVNGRRVPVEVGYAVAPDNTVGFNLGTYDHTRPLTIDPTLEYNTYIGGSGNDFAHSIAVDKDGAAYIAGQTLSTNFPLAPIVNLTPTPYDSELTGTSDAFVTKLSADGTTREYSTYLGGNGAEGEKRVSIAVDGAGNAYITGDTTSDKFPTYQAVDEYFNNGEGADVFVTKLNAQGSELIYSTYLAGDADDVSFSIAVDKDGAAYITGATQSGSSKNNPDEFPNTSTAWARETQGSADIFVTKLAIKNNELNLAYSTYLGGDKADNAFDITVDNDGNVYIAGSVKTDDVQPPPTPTFPTKGKADTTFEGVEDAFVMKLNISASGQDQIVYSTFLGGNASDQAQSIALDHRNHVYVTGRTNSTDFPIQNAYDGDPNGGNDIFVTGLDMQNAPLVYSTYFGGSGDDRGLGIAVDGAGYVYITGDTKAPASDGTKLPIKDATFSATYSGGTTDAFVVQLDVRAGPLGLSYSTYLGSPGVDEGRGIVLDDTYNVLITGKAGGTFQESSSNEAYSGGLDAFVLKLGNPPSSATKMSLKAAHPEIGRNQIFSVEIMVDRGNTPINEVKAYLNFNSNVLEVVKADGTTGSAITPSDWVILPAATNTVGTDQINFVANLKDNLPSEFSVATVYFRVKPTAALSETPINLVQDKYTNRFSELLNDGFRTRATATGTAITVFNGVLLRGKVAVEQRDSGNPLGQSIDLFRRIEPGTETEAGIVITNTQEITSVNGITTTVEGRFAPIKVMGISADTYNVKIKGDNTLSITRSVDLRFTNEIDFGTLPAGDTNGDDMVNGGDVSYIAPAFQLENTDPLFRSYADVNRDGEISDPDISGLICNFLKTGPIGVTANDHQCPPPTTPAIAAAAEPAAFGVHTARQTVRAGEIFTASLNLNLQTASADTIGAYLNFDPRHLEVVDATGQPTTRLDLNTAIFRSATYNTVNNAQGRIGLSVSRFTEPWLTGNMSIATVRFRAKLPVDTTQIALVQDGSRRSDAFRGGSALGVSRSSAEVTVIGAVHHVYLPYATQ